jgi:hypothetical protein
MSLLPARLRLFALAAGLAAALAPLPLAAELPVVRSLQPAGFTRGEAAVLTLRGERLAGARELHLLDPRGVSAGEPKAGEGGAVEIPLAIAADAPQGERLARLRTDGGWSYLFGLWVGGEPRVAEIEPNNEPAQAQAVALPAAIEGEIKPEDVDVFAVELKQGQRLTAAVEAVRLGRMLLDTHLSVLDARRFEVAACDDHPLTAQDPLVSFVAPADGVYHVQIREAAYEGAEGAFYRLRLGHWRQPVAVAPPGARPGETVEARVRFACGGAETRGVTWPAGPQGTARLDFADDGSGEAPVPLPVRCLDAPWTPETEPNNARAEATAAGAGVPAALHGTLDPPGDEDWFGIGLKNGQVVEIAAWARALGSPADVAVDAFDPAGKHLGGNDDANNQPDSRHTFTAAADGVHFIRVRDSLKAGGPGAFYRIELAAQGPALALSLPANVVNDSQSNQTILVPAGNRVARAFNVTRTRVGGALGLELREAPPGLALANPAVAAGAAQALLLFEAAADAAPAGAFADLVARLAEPPLEGRYGLSANLVTYQNNEPIYQVRMPRLAAGIGTPVPLAIEAAPATVLVQGGQADLRVTATRGEGFASAVELKLPWKPGGVSAPPAVTLAEAAVEAVIPLEAEAGAATGSHALAVTAHWGAGSEVATRLFPLVVEEAYLRGTIEMAAVTAGGEARLLLKLEHLRPYEGAAELTVLGLPPGIEIPPLQVAAGQAEAVFTVKAGGDAPPGKHGTLFCRALVPAGGARLVHRLGGGGVLRIDKAPAGETPAPPPPAAAAPGQQPPKPLSRLEQLRQKAKQ